MPFQKHAILIDGGYFQKIFNGIHSVYPKAKDIEKYCEQYKKLPFLNNSRLYRIFFYNSLPCEIHENHPMTGKRVDKFPKEVISESQNLWNELDKTNYFAMRQGTLKRRGWALKKYALESMKKQSTWTLKPSDIELQVIQKQVDLKIGMDIAHLAFKGLVSKVVILTNDGDLAPAVKLARVEGIQVFLDCLNRTPPSELVHHSDVILKMALPEKPAWSLQPNTAPMASPRP